MARLSPKQPFEEYYIGFDFSSVITTSEIVSASVIAVNSTTNEDVTDVITNITYQKFSGSIVNIWICNGDPGILYKLTCRIITDDVPNNKYEMEAYLFCIDK